MRIIICLNTGACCQITCDQINESAGQLVFTRGDETVGRFNQSAVAGWARVPELTDETKEFNDAVKDLQ